jgi:hypothetical protein
MNRRSFLRGSAGAALPLPFLNLMEASAKESGQDEPPLRFMTLFKPNGVHPPSWHINGGSEFDFRMSPLMQPFAKHKDDLLILDNMGDFGFSSHANSTRRFLSGHHENTRSASIDQHIADKIAGDTPHRSLELTTEGLFPNQIGCSYISYDAKGQPIPRESDPQLIFDRLFRSPLSHPQKRAEMASLLDRVRDDAKSLTRRAGTEDRDTLDQYLTVVRETEQRLQKMQQRSAATTDFSSFKRPERSANLDEQVTSMIDLIALAMWTDSSRCITYMLGNSNSRMIFDFLGVKEQHHYLSHFFRNFSRSNLEGLLKISRWHMEKFDYLLTRLKSFKDHNGTLLDHSVVLFGSGMGHRDNHTVTRRARRRFPEDRSLRAVFRKPATATSAPVAAAEVRHRSAVVRRIEHSPARPGRVGLYAVERTPVRKLGQGRRHHNHRPGPTANVRQSGRSEDLLRRRRGQTTGPSRSRLPRFPQLQHRLPLRNAGNAERHGPNRRRPADDH